MRRLLVAATAVGATGLAHAQSSVTLYGIADTGLTYISNAKGGRQLAMTTGNEGATRWGLTGNEDLGGGLKAIFTLESGYNIDTGAILQNGTEFGRQAFVGLADERYGTLSAGRQYSVAYTVVGPYSAGGDWAMAGAGFGAHPGDVDNLDSFNRVANSIKYQTPSFGGLRFAGLYSFGGKAGDFTRNELWELAASYANGPVYLATGYMFTKNPNFSFWGNKANDSATASNMTSPVNAGYASAGSQQIFSAVGTYTFGPATVGLVYSNTQFKNLGSVTVAGLTPQESAYRGNAVFNIGELNLKYRLTPALLLGASYAYARNSGAGNAGTARYQQVNLGATYSLSKRTSFYLVGVHQNARGIDSTGTIAVAAIAGATPSSSGSQTLVTAGLTHKF